MIDLTTFRPLTTDDRVGVQRIINHYVEFSFAAYAEEALSLDDIVELLKDSSEFPSIAIIDDTDHVIGFGMLRPYSPLGTFASTALITYFIAPEHTRKGLGPVLLAALEQQARERGITTLLAHVSSKNDGSLRFHRRHGFEECGTFHNIGKKRGQNFDVVWFEKPLADSDA